MNSVLLLREERLKRQFSLAEIFDLENSLKIMRKKYHQVGWWEKKELEKNAQTIKKRLENNRTQYKIFCKKGLDDFSKSVVEALF